MNRETVEAKIYSVTRIVIIFATMGFLSGVVFAASCPYCRQEYGDGPSDSGAYLDRIRAQHEAVCPNRPSGVLGDDGYKVTDDVYWQEEQRNEEIEQQRLEIQDQEEAEQRRQEEAQKQEFFQEKQEVLGQLKGIAGESLDAKHGFKGAPTPKLGLKGMSPESSGLKQPRFSKGTKYSAPVKLLLSKEQDEFDRMNDAWMKKQQALVREAVERDNKWTNEVFSAIKETRVPELGRPSTPNDLKPGDIILVSPDKESFVSRAIPTGDQFIRAANHLAQGKVFEAATTEKVLVSHSVVFVKSVGDNRLYLDHTWDDGYSRILDEQEFQKRYGNRLQYLARPKAPIDGKKLWKVAREAALKDATRYGVVGEEDFVCSEVDGVAIVKASGKRVHLEPKRLGLVDLTPADFYDKKTNGKYFIVSPLKNEP